MNDESNNEPNDDPLPDPPMELDAVAQAKWDQLVGLVWEVGWNPGTGHALCAYCVNWSRWQAAEAEVAKLGPVIKSPSP